MSVTRARRRPGPWLVTVAATAASTYALEAVATAAGVALAASGVLDGLGRPLLLAVLAATYLLWFAGMRANLAANWSLLGRTGASTNLLSKAAFALASERWRRPAASAGYVLCELAKEAPYYAGAFAADLASDAVSRADALVFLAGTNLGAALYEYGVAGVTRVLLAR